jgi:hypothetical protein
VTLSHSLPVIRVPLSAIRELDEDHWFAHGPATPTCRSIVEHCRLIAEADLTYPVILDASGRVMDGMHRACRALLEGRAEIPAVRFSSDPPPDYVGREPESLPYD